MTESDVKKIVAARVARKLSPLAKELAGPVKFWVAGGALIRDGGDVDLFPCGEWPSGLLARCSVVAESKNARTVSVEGVPFQFCKHTRPTLGELLRSFDFAHCQVGCAVDVLDGGSLVVDEPEWTPEYATSRCGGTSWFTGSEFPLSSLIRVSKYRRNDILSSGAAIHATIDALVAVVDRGFKSYEDFKNQLDAVDLGLLPDELADVEKASLVKLFDLLHKPCEAAKLAQRASERETRA